MSDYTIKGGDGNEYGPVNADQLREWIQQGRANGLTQVKNGDGPWTQLNQINEFKNLFGNVAPPTDKDKSLPPLHAPESGPRSTMEMLGSANNLGNKTVIAIADPMAKAAGWMKLSAIVMFVNAAFQIIGTFGIGIIFAWLPIWMGVLLWKGANRFKEALIEGDEASAILGADNIKTYFVITGVLAAIGIIFFVLYMVLVFVLGASGMLQNLQFQ